MEFAKACRFYVLHKKTRIRTVQLLMNWNTKLDYAENAKKLKITKGYASVLRARYKLKCKSIYEKKREVPFLKINQLLKLGFTFEHIGRLYGVSKQAINVRANSLRSKRVHGRRKHGRLSRRS